MKIAIVAPSPIPFTLGGSERLWLGLQNYLNEKTDHQCDLIKLPTREHDFWDLIESYERFSQLDLSHFDLVISGKYPAWMVRHPNHHVYMLHRLRGLYDTYDLFGKASVLESPEPALRAILRLVNARAPVEQVFAALRDWKRSGSDPAVTDFPGPLIRSLVHYFDDQALDNVQSFSAISRTVAHRQGYFPPGKPVGVVYPPTQLPVSEVTGYEYYFTVSRLDEAKRIEMILDAYLLSGSTRKLKIAGTGPLGAKLKAKAAGKANVEFLGFVSDDDLSQLYAGAYAVIFIPMDEDYGLVTLEAMRSSKPVITFSDSGGVTEFVTGATGSICAPRVEDLAQTINEYDRLGVERIEARGESARKSVSDIDWVSAGSTLLAQMRRPAGARRLLTVVSTYPIYPPRGGGQNRLYYLYREVARSFDVEVVCLTASGQLQRQLLEPGLTQILVPKPQKVLELEIELEAGLGVPASDAVLLEQPEFEELAQLLGEAKKRGSFFICAQPYSQPVLARLGITPLVHDSQNCETILKRAMYRDNETSRRVIERLREAEAACCSESSFNVVCTLADIGPLREGIDSDHLQFEEIPNGVDLATVPFTPMAERRANKMAVGLAERPTVLFMGSWHQPNIDAVQVVFRMAAECPESLFLILGSVGAFYRNEGPKNVAWLGTVDDEEKAYVLSMVDWAVNPMLSGSGTNLKMLDYMAAGVPVVSTEVGVRGLGIPDGLVSVVDENGFSAIIRTVPDLTTTLRARQFVEERYDWRQIGARYVQALKKATGEADDE